MPVVTELEHRLREWADEYAGSRYEHVGWPRSSSMDALIKYHGRPPQGLHPKAIVGTAADEVEGAVRELASPRIGGARQALVLRNWYWMKEAAMEHRLQALRAHRLHISERGYRLFLQNGRFYVAGLLDVAMQPGDLCIDPEEAASYRVPLLTVPKK
ncbi:hypothetical protein [Dyella japonica]|uniref:Uncharacterized protein n=1 Tax=Dyella japonica TaxID=231455 RepID=A0ABV2K0W5_9GAMM